MKINSEQEMLDFGKTIAKLINQTGDATWGTPTELAKMGEKWRQDPSSIIELVGDVGAGKTTFTRGLAQGLGATSEVTSPSFTISKSYALKDGRTLTHYDFYRLPDPGLMQDDLAEKLSDNNSVIVIEWGDSISDLLPENHIKIEIRLQDDGSREVIL